MKVVILCGGRGTRIRDANEALPKPMLPIGNRPIVWHIMKTYSHFGYDDFVLCLGYKSWLIKEFFLNYGAMTNDITVTLGRGRGYTVASNHDEEEWKVTLAETGEATETGGRVLAIRKYVEDADVFLLTYGDGVANVDVPAVIDFHRAHGKIATVTAVRPPGRFGELEVRNGIVSQFNEKPQTSAGHINGGYLVVDARRIWRYLGNGAATVLEREPMQGLAADGELAAYPHEGFWQPMDTLREFTLLNQLWESGQAPWKIW